MKSAIISLIESLHQRLFGQSLSAEMRSFLGNLSWSFFAGLVSLPILLIVATLAVRLMGPVEYGKYNLLLVVNQLLILFIFFGLDTTTVKYIAKARSFDERKQIISASFGFIVFALILMVVTGLILYPLSLHFYPAYSSLIILLLYYMVIMSLKTFFDLVVRGLENFKKQAFGKILEAGVVLIGFVVVFLVLRKTNFVSFLFVINAGAVALAVYYWVGIKKYLAKPNRQVIRVQLRESKLFFAATLFGTLFAAADKLVVSKSLGIGALGIYSAYYLASFGVVAQLTVLFTNVFLPIASRLKDKFFANKIDRLLTLGFIPLTLLTAGVMLLMLAIFGREYPVNPLYVIGFSVFATLNFFQSLYNTVIIDTVRTEYRKYMLINNGTNLLAVIFFLIAMYFQVISIALILGTLIVDYILTIFIQRLFIKSMQQA